MVTVRDILSNIEELAPAALKMDFDNVGHLVGSKKATVERVMLSLDITDEVIAEAVNEQAQLIVSHHPLFFGLKKVVDDDLIGRKLIRLIQNNISAICMHTNLDAAEGGVNSCLAKAAGIIAPIKLYDKPDNIGYYGELAEAVELEDYLKNIKDNLNVNCLRYVTSGKAVKRVAVLGGSGGDDMERAIELECDTFISADLKYHRFLQAKEYGINLIDGDHFCTENVVIPELQKRLSEAFPEIEFIISKKHRQTVQFF